MKTTNNAGTRDSDLTCDQADAIRTGRDWTPAFARGEGNKRCVPVTCTVQHEPGTVDLFCACFGES